MHPTKPNLLTSASSKMEPLTTVESVIKVLESLYSEENILGMKRFGISAEKAFGVGMQPLNEKQFK